MLKKEIIRCRCHGQPVRTKKGKFPGEKKYYCDVTGTQLFNNFIYEKVKTNNIRDPDDTWDGSEVECPEDLEEALVDYKKKAAGNGDD